MKCTEKKCIGEIDINQSFVLQTGCFSSTAVFPCDVCGFLHKLMGDEVHKTPVGMARRSGEKVFFRNGAIEHEEI